MANRNVDKGREAENAVARVLQAHGMLHAERRSKRGGTVPLDCASCQRTGGDPDTQRECAECKGLGMVAVPADAGDLTGIPGVVVQVKWSGYKSLAEDMRRTDEQRRVAGADVGLLVRKRKAVGCGRAGEWDTYMDARTHAHLFIAAARSGHIAVPNPQAVWHTDLTTAAQLLVLAGYGTPARDLEALSHGV